MRGYAGFRVEECNVEMCCGTEASSCLRRIDYCITQLEAQIPSRTCNESKEEEEGATASSLRPRAGAFLLFFFFTLVTGPRRSLSLEQVYEPFGADYYPALGLGFRVYGHLTRFSNVYGL